MSTSQQDREFGAAFLGDIIRRIAENMEPANVFDDAALRAWAEAHDFVHANNIEPYHCKERDLEAWAKDNGYTQETP